MGVTDPLRSETDGRVRVITLARADEYNTINPALRDALSDTLDDADRDRGVHAVLFRAGRPRVLRRVPARLGDRGAGGYRRVEGAGLGFRGRRADDRPVRGDVGKVAHDLEADGGRGARLVYCGRHQHGAQRRLDRVQRVGAIRLPADAGLGDPRGAVGMGRTPSGSSAPSVTSSPETRSPVRKRRSSVLCWNALPTTRSRITRSVSRTGSPACRSSSSR